MREPKYQKKDKLLFVTCDEVCYKITKENWEEVTELKSTQEEADTRMLLHAFHAANAGCKAIIITADDTDVLVICLGLNSNFPYPIYQKRGTQNLVRFLDIGKLARAIAKSICNAVVGLHAFTGCDTVSAFAGRGKLSAFKQMKASTTYQEAFSQLGQSWDLSADLFQKLQEITCHIYVSSAHTSSVNELVINKTLGRALDPRANGSWLSKLTE